MKDPTKYRILAGFSIRVSLKTEFMVIGTLQQLNQLDSGPESTPYAIVADGQKGQDCKYLGMMVDDKLV